MLFPEMCDHIWQEGLRRACEEMRIDNLSDCELQKMFADFKRSPATAKMRADCTRRFRCALNLRSLDYRQAVMVIDGCIFAAKDCHTRFLMRENGSEECIVCCNADQTFTFLPCRHRVCCQGCAEFWISKHGVCPWCNSAVQGTMENGVCNTFVENRLNTTRV